LSAMINFLGNCSMAGTELHIIRAIGTSGSILLVVGGLLPAACWLVVDALDRLDLI